VPGPTPHYPPEFKREAVQLYRSSGESISKIAEELGVSTESLRRWVNQHEIDEGEREGLSSEERKELSKLRRENKTLRQEREFLKKAAVDSTGRCSRQTYSSPRVHAELRALGSRCVGANGLRGSCARPDCGAGCGRREGTTRRDKRAPCTGPREEKLCGHGGRQSLGGGHHIRRHR
jgi:transposase